MYLALWATAPVLAFGTNYRIAAVLAMAVWLFLELARKNGIAYRPGLVVLLALVYVAYTAMISHFFDPTDSITRQLSVYICILFLLIHQSFSRIDVSLLKPAFWAVMVTFPVWQVITLAAYLRDPHISRTLVRSSEEAVQASAAGIGGYAFVYGLVFLVPMLVFLLAKTRLARGARNVSAKRVKWRRLAMLLLALNCLLGILVVLRAGYALAVVLLFIGLVLVLAPRAHKRFLGVVLSASIVMILAIALYLPSLQNQLTQIALETEYSEKVQDIFLSAESDETIGTVGARFGRYAKSVTAFASSPLLGSLSRAAVGKHSPILDNFGQYGLIIGTLFAFLFLVMPARYLRTKDELLPLSRAIFALVLLFSLLNNHTPTFGVVVFLLYPVIRQYGREWS